MVESRDQESATSGTGELDEAELLGFEHVEIRQDPSISAEEAVAVAFNKRGASGEGPAISDRRGQSEGPTVPSDRRLKTDVKRVGEAAGGVNLYSFRYVGEDRQFWGVMAQELLADERNCRAVEAGADGYFRVDYASLGLASLVTDEMLAAGERAARRAATLAL